jgi:hypothetical protein
MFDHLDNSAFQDDDLAREWFVVHQRALCGNSHPLVSRPSLWRGEAGSFIAAPWKGQDSLAEG